MIAAIVAGLIFLLSSPGSIDPADYPGHPEIQEVLKSIHTDAGWPGQAIGDLADTDDSMSVDALLAVQRKLKDRLREEGLFSAKDCVINAFKAIYDLDWDEFETEIADARECLSETVQVVRPFVVCFGKYDNEKAVAYLIKALMNNDEDSSNMAAYGLCNMNEEQIKRYASTIEKAFLDSVALEEISWKISLYSRIPPSYCGKTLKKFLKRRREDYTAFDCGKILAKNYTFKEVEDMLSDEDLRVAATYALQYYDEVGVMGYLLSLIKDPDCNVRRAALFASIYMEGGEAICREALKDVDEKIRNEALEYGEWNPKVENSIAFSMVCDSDPKVRSMAIQKMNVEDANALKTTLWNMCRNDPNANVREAALWRLSCVDPLKAADVIFDKITSNFMEVSYFQIMNSICMELRRDKKDLSELRAKFKENLGEIYKSSPFATDAAFCLAKLGDVSLLMDYDRKMSADEDWGQRAWIAIELFELGDSILCFKLSRDIANHGIDEESIKGVGILGCRLMDSSLPEVKELCFSILKILGDDLKKTVRGKNRELACESLRCLGYLGDCKTALEVLRGPSKSYSLKLAAIKALGDAGNPAAVDDLIAVLDKSLKGEMPKYMWPHEYSEAAIESLGKLCKSGNGGAENRGKIIEAIKKAMEASYAQTREDAVNGLAVIGGEDVMGVLKERLKVEKDIEVRKALRVAIFRLSRTKAPGGDD